MRTVNFGVLILALSAAFTAAVPTFAGAAKPAPISGWEVVVNNGYDMPSDSCKPAEPSTACKKFNSYNQPSVNADKLVVIRARSRGGGGAGQPVHGIYTRDMAVAGGPVVKVLDRKTLAPQPNNLGTNFTEPPAFPRIGVYSNSVATRGNHQPTWVDENGDKFGTTGIYANPFGTLITGVNKLGVLQDFSFFEVPGVRSLTPFDVFPGSPAITGGSTIVFKGNFTEGGIGKTGVYYRNLRDASIPLLEGSSLSPAGGVKPVELIANTNTLIPGTSTPFGSLGPPSAADNKALFVGLDNEDNPSLGGIYLVRLPGPEPVLKEIVKLGSKVPGERRARFNRLGEGLSFDGRFVAFWGAWGKDANTLDLKCPTEGNAERVAYCKQLCKFKPANCIRRVPVHQGIFVDDLKTGHTYAVAKTGMDFSDFLYWNFSGHVPGSAGEDDGEPARWRASAFVAVSGLVDGSLTDATFHVVFKARGDEAVDGIHLGKGPGKSPLFTLVYTGMEGSILDPDAINLPVTQMGIERDGFRGNSIVINAVMGSEETGWAGVYLTEVLRRGDRNGDRKVDRSDLAAVKGCLGKKAARWGLSRKPR